MLWRQGVMLQVIFQGYKNWLAIGQHDSVAWLSRLLLETGHSGIVVTHSLSRKSSLPGNHGRALHVSGSLGTLREVQGGKGDLFSHSTLARGGQATNHLLHLKVDSGNLVSKSCTL